MSSEQPVGDVAALDEQPKTDENNGAMASLPPEGLEQMFEELIELRTHYVKTTFIAKHMRQVLAAAAILVSTCESQQSDEDSKDTESARRDMAQSGDLKVDQSLVFRACKDAIPVLYHWNQQLLLSHNDPEADSKEDIEETVEWVKETSWWDDAAQAAARATERGRDVDDPLAELSEEEEILDTIQEEDEEESEEEESEEESSESEELLEAVSPNTAVRKVMQRATKEQARKAKKLAPKRPLRRAASAERKVSRKERSEVERMASPPPAPRNRSKKSDTPTRTRRTLSAGKLKHVGSIYDRLSQPKTVNSKNKASKAGRSNWLFGAQDPLSLYTGMKKAGSVEEEAEKKTKPQSASRRRRGSMPRSDMLARLTRSTAQQARREQETKRQQKQRRRQQRRSMRKDMSTQPPPHAPDDEDALIDEEDPEAMADASPRAEETSLTPNE